MSFLNHGENSNLRLEYPTSDFSLVLAYAAKDIQRGEEVVIDYCPGFADPEARKTALRRWGIGVEAPEPPKPPVKDEDARPSRLD